MGAARTAAGRNPIETVAPAMNWSGSTEAWDDWWQAQSLPNGLETAGPRTIAVAP